MFGAKKDKEEHKIKIKFEKKDKVEKESLPFIMFLKKFCETFGLSTEDLNTKKAEDPKYNYFTNSKYDFCFYYIDTDGDRVFIHTNEDFYTFYINKDCYEEKSKIRHLFFTKNEDDNNINKVYDDIIENKKFKNISITVYINEDIEEEKKEEIKEENNHIENNHHEDDDKNSNGDVNCPCCNCC